MYAAPNIFAMRSGTAMPAGNWRGMPSTMTPPGVQSGPVPPQGLPPQAMPPQPGGPTMMPMRPPMIAPEGPGMMPPQPMPPQFQAGGPVAGPMPVRPGLMMPPQPGQQPPGVMPMRPGMPPMADPRMIDPRMQNVFAQRSMMPMQRQF